MFVAVAEHSAWEFEQVHESFAKFDDLLTLVVLVVVAVLHADLSVAVAVGTGWAEPGTAEGEVAAHSPSLVVASVGLVEA